MTRECWLVSNGNVLASAEVASSHADRGKGLIGRASIGGAFVLERTKWVHTMGMKFAIDVAHLDSNGAVIKISHMHPHRLGTFVRQASRVVEAPSGAFERWGLRLGDVVELRE